MWCFHDIDFKVNYTEDCLTSGRDLKWTLQQQQQKKRTNKKQKNKKRQVCLRLRPHEDDCKRKEQKTHIFISVHTKTIIVYVAFSNLSTLECVFEFMCLR